MKVSERLKVVDVIGTKVYKDGEQIIAQVQFLPSFSFSFIIRNNNYVIYRQYVLSNPIFLSHIKSMNLKCKRWLFCFKSSLFAYDTFKNNPLCWYK